MGTESSFGQQPQDAAPGGQALTIEELRAAQAKRDEELSAAKRQEDEEAVKQKELQDKTETDAGLSEQVLAELRLSQAEVDKLRAERIDERIASADQLRESQASKEAQLQETREQLERIEKNLADIQSLAEGKSGGEIAPEVTAAIEQAQTQKSEIQGALEGLTRDLAAMGERAVSDVQVNRYRELLQRMDELNKQMVDIESNPLMIERLFDEAKREDEMRDIVVSRAVGRTYTGYEETKKDKIMKEVVQRFLTEEFEGQGIN